MTDIFETKDIVKNEALSVDVRVATPPKIVTLTIETASAAPTLCIEHSS